MDDLISRRAAIDAVEQLRGGCITDAASGLVRYQLLNVQSAERQKGTMSAHDVRAEFSRERKRYKSALGDKCVYCGADADDIHHIIPVHMGGDNRIGNLVPLCYECHLKAHSRKQYTENKNNGRPKAKRPKNFDSIIRLYANNDISFCEALKRTGLLKNTFYKMMHEWERENDTKVRHTINAYKKKNYQIALKL